MTGLTDKIDEEREGIAAIGAYLDSLDAETRWREVKHLDRARQRILYEKAAHAAQIDFGHFVGDARPCEEVIHDGVNTLPLPAPWKRFQKRFCRPGGGGGGGDGRADVRLFGA
jgi:hypothetical protein